ERGGQCGEAAVERAVRWAHGILLAHEARKRRARCQRPPGRARAAGPELTGAEREAYEPVVSSWMRITISWREPGGTLTGTTTCRGSPSPAAPGFDVSVAAGVARGSPADGDGAGRRVEADGRGTDALRGPSPAALAEVAPLELPSPWSRGSSSSV